MTICLKFLWGRGGGGCFDILHKFRRYLIRILIGNGMQWMHQNSWIIFCNTYTAFLRACINPSDIIEGFKNMNIFSN
jgi:hypothetical protein